MGCGSHGEHGPLAFCPVDQEVMNEIELVLGHSMTVKTVQEVIKKKMSAQTVLVSIFYSILVTNTTEYTSFQQVPDPAQLRIKLPIIMVWIAVLQYLTLLEKYSDTTAHRKCVLKTSEFLVLKFPQEHAKSTYLVKSEKNSTWDFCIFLKVSFLHFKAQTGTCPDENYHSFDNGFHCCRRYASIIDQTILLGNDQGKAHCPPDEVVACPDLPTKRCKIKPFSK